MHKNRLEGIPIVLRPRFKKNAVAAEDKRAVKNEGAGGYLLTLNQRATAHPSNVTTLMAAPTRNDSGA